MKFKLISKPELLSRSGRDEEWFIPNLLPVGGTTIVYGAPGWGKSTICLEWALALCNGRSFASSEHFVGEFVGNPIRVAWLSFEDDWEDEATGRLLKHGEDIAWPDFVTEPSKGAWGDAVSLMISPNRQGDGSAIPSATRDHWEELCIDLRDAGVQLLFIDTLSELVDSEANPRLIQSCFSMFGRLRKEYGVTFVLIGHASAHKDNGKRKDELMGHTAWTAKARHTVLVDGNTSETFAKVTKSNRGPTGFNVTMRKVDGSPVTVVKVNTAQEYVQDRQKQQQERDWANLRANAEKAAMAGAPAWTSAKSLGEAAGGSASIGRRLFKAGYFVKKGRGQYAPDWDRIGLEQPDPAVLLETNERTNVRL